MNHLEPYHVQDDKGNALVFYIVENRTKPCPQCGVPACGKEDILWYEKEGKRIAIIFDGGLFDLAIEMYFQKNVNANNYSTLPKFLRAWNEDIEWAANWDYNGFDIDGFIQTMNLLKGNEWISDDCLNVLENLAREAQGYRLVLKIVRG